MAAKSLPGARPLKLATTPFSERWRGSRSLSYSALPLYLARDKVLNLFHLLKFPKDDIRSLKLVVYKMLLQPLNKNKQI